MVKQLKPTVGVNDTGTMSHQTVLVPHETANALVHCQEVIS